MEVGDASEEFTSSFETRENTAKSNAIHGVQQRLEGHIPPEYNSKSSSFYSFSTTSGCCEAACFCCPSIAPASCLKQRSAHSQADRADRSSPFRSVHPHAECRWERHRRSHGPYQASSQFLVHVVCSLDYPPRIGV